MRLLDLRSEERPGGDWHEVPRLVLGALRVAWSASRRLLLETLLLQTGAGLAVALQLLAAQRVLQALLTIDQSGAADSLIAPFALLFGAMLAMGGVTALADHRQRLLGEVVAQHALGRIMAVAARVRLEAFESPGFHDQLERARTSAIARSLQMVGSVSGVTFNALTGGGIVVALLVLEPLLLPLVAISSLPILAATIRNSRRAYGFEWAMTPENRERAYLIELLTRREAAKEIRAFGAGDFLRARYDSLNEERLRRIRDFLRRRLGVAMMGTLGTTLGLGIALAALALLIASKQIDVATAVAAGAAMQQLSSRLFGMMAGIGQLVESGMFVDDYSAFLKLLPAASGSDADGPGFTGRAPRERFRGVRLRGVSFAYPGTDVPVLKEVTIRVDPGEVVALVGENGCGKTTLVKLICQLYEPQAGEISWLGAEESAAEPRHVREDVTVLFQDFLQYHLSAADNISLGRPGGEPLPGAIEAAAAQAGAAEFLAELSDGFETRLGREFASGHDLSIGQWQRLALARAFYRGGGLLVLDEPTASLDPRAEHELFERMRELWSGRAVLLVSHRFSSVRTADRICVLRHGRVSESGAHAELMAQGGHYAELFSLQAAAYLGEEHSTPSSRKNRAAATVPGP